MFMLSVLAGGCLLLGLQFFAVPSGSSLPSRNPGDGAHEFLLDNRGTIYDRTFKELAVTLDKVSVFADVRDVDIDKAAEALAPVFGREPAEIGELIGREHYRAWIARNISTDEEEQVAALGLRGVHLHRERARYYPERQSAAHVIGYVGKSVGLAGVEFNYNSLLNRYDAGTLVGEDDRVEEDTQEGGSGRYLVLTLDLKIQRMLENLLAELGGLREDGRFAGLFLECATGRIIGAAGFPSYDPNSFDDYGWEVLDNLLVQPIAVPQRIREILWNASLLQASYEHNSSVLPWSVLAPTRDLGSQLRLWDRLGLNDRLEADFVKSDSAPGAAPRSMVPANPYDSIVERATPLHIVAALQGVVRGGRRTMPHVIDKMAGGDGKVVALKAREAKDGVAAPVAAEVLRMLGDQMTEGPLSSGYLETASLSYVASQKGRRYLDNRLYFSLIPQDRPELMLFVFAQLPPFSPVAAETKSSFSIAEPARQVTTAMVAMQKVMSNLSDMMTAEEREKMNFELQKNVGKDVILADLEREAVYGDMPDLTGLSLRKSLRCLQDLKLEIQISGTGVVVEQTPPAGHQVKPGELCRLVLKPH